MTQRIIFLVLILSLGILLSCSGGGNDTPCAAPILDATGTWCVTITDMNNNCGAPPTPAVPYAAVYTQTGNSLSVTAKSVTYTGTICGNIATVTGPTSSISTQVTFSDANHASGTTTWDAGTCQGTDTSIATKGTCS
jgi:hypothetical protein